MSSVREIAKQVGVSAATVSRALRGHPGISSVTRRRIVSAANRAGYSRARSDVTETMMIGFASTSPTPALSLYDCMLLNGVRRGLAGGGFEVQLVDLHRDKPAGETYTEFFERRRLRGVVVQSDTEHRAICHAIHAEGFPCVVLAEEFDEPEISFVCCDARGEIAQMVDHLVQLGHTRIGLAVPEHQDHDHANRVVGYREALREHDLELDASLVVRISPSREGGGHAINELMSRRQPPTAIFVTDPYPAIGALCRTLEVGLAVPGQLSLVGFDDGQMRRQVYPLLTAICQPTEQIGFLASQWMVKRVAGAVDEPLRRVLPATFEVNQTTAVPPEKVVRIQPDGSPFRVS
ncbi:MAG: LacI family DNA-binding transcriptional regulator [Phycisphaeraceae bacterium]